MYRKWGRGWYNYGYTNRLQYDKRIAPLEIVMMEMFAAKKPALARCVLLYRELSKWLTGFIPCRTNDDHSHLAILHYITYVLG
jgi:hypothetical protein